MKPYHGRKRKLELELVSDEALKYQSRYAYGIAKIPTSATGDTL